MSDMSADGEAGRRQGSGEPDDVSAAVLRLEDGLRVASRSVTDYRALAKGNPGEFRPLLGVSLNEQSRFLADLGRDDEALAAIREAVTIFRSLSEASGDELRA